MPDQNNTNSYYDFSNTTLTIQSILDVFVLQDLISQNDAQKLKDKLKTNRKIENFLTKNRIVSKDTVNKAYSIILKMPYVETKDIVIPAEVKALISEKIVKQYGIIPFDLKDGIIKIAVSRPADLLVSYTDSLGKIFQEKNLEIELFITGESDFNQVVKQYSQKFKPSDEKNTSAMPVVYLRSQNIANQYLNKIPKEFIEKYRIVVFGQNKRGYYLVACEQPEAAITKKILEFIEGENEIKFEVFKTSKEDVDFVLESFSKKTVAKAVDKSTSSPSQDQKKIVSESEKTGKSFITGILDTFSGANEPELTIDNIEKVSKTINSPELEGNISTYESLKTMPEVNPVDSQKPVNLSVPSSDQVTATQPISQDAKTVSQATSNLESVNAPVIEIKSDPAPTPAESKAAEGGEYESKNLGSFLDHNISTEADLTSAIQSNSVPKIVAAVLDFALNNRSSDLHVEPEAKILRIRCRVDGILRDIAKLPLSLHAPFVSRIKIMSKLKIDETRIPQDGRFDTVFEDREVDVRVSTLPTIHGEKIVMRILDKSQGILSLEDLGMQGSAFDKTMEAMKKPYGIILSTGPTGSGKSTTLYAVLNRISVPGVNIVTLEDPVEYDIAGINQCQIKPDIGFTFASGLRSILRQDPNVIMVGEIRDVETAGMAVHAALTGHLVLSTLHTNDTAGTLPRLIDMGVEPFLVTSSINLILAQRLVRRICPKCKEELRVPQKLIEQIIEEMKKIPASNAKDRELIPDTIKLYHGKGCPECNQGFKGRVGIYEAMTLSQEIEDMVIAKKSANEIKDASVKEGMITMKQDGIIKALMGLTTIDEVFQAVVNG